MTRALLACGVVAGPLYVTVTLLQALTRDGFDLRQHRFTLLTSGDLGWIHQANMVMVGTLTILLAVGVRQMMRTGRGSVWGPRLLGAFGLVYLVGGLLSADPIVGFPPGTTPEGVQTTWQGAVQNASRGISTLLLLATSAVIAVRFAAEGHRRWAWFYGAAIPVVFASLTAVGVVIGGNPVAVAFVATPWIWVTALAVPLYRRAARESVMTPARSLIQVALIAALVGGFALAGMAAEQGSVQPDAARVYTMSAGRFGAIVAIALGLTGVVIGALALSRPEGRFGTSNGRLGANVALAAALIGVALGALVVATSDAGIGTGNGRGGAYVALVVGLIGLAFGGLASRSASRP